MTWIVAGLIALAGGTQITSPVGIAYYQTRRNARLLGTFEYSRSGAIAGAEQVVSILQQQIDAFRELSSSLAYENE